MSREDIRKNLSNILFTYRTSHNLSQETMAELCCLSCRGYKDLEHGKRVPSLDTTLRIQKIIGFDLNVFTH